MFQCCKQYVLLWQQVKMLLYLCTRGYAKRNEMLFLMVLHTDILDYLQCFSLYFHSPLSISILLIALALPEILTIIPELKITLLSGRHNALFILF